MAADGIETLLAFVEGHAAVQRAPTPRELAELVWLRAQLPGAGSTLEKPSPDQERPGSSSKPETPQRPQEVTPADQHERRPASSPASAAIPASVPLRLPPPLDAPLHQARGLFGLGRRLPARSHMRLDVRASVARSAESRTLQLVFLPEQYRATQLLLLIDRAGQMEPYARAFDRFVGLAHMVRGFRGVEVLELNLSGAGPLLTRPAEAGGAAVDRLPASCVSAEDLLVLAVSDGLGPAFANGRLGDTLQRLAPTARVAWLHPWEMAHWRRSGFPRLARVLGTSSLRSADALPVSVAPWNPFGLAALGRWSQGRALQSLALVRLPTQPREVIPAPREQDTDWVERTHRIAEQVQPVTRRLLALAAAVPGRVDLALLEALGHEFAPEFTRFHLAEAMSSGLFERAPESPYGHALLRFRSDEARQTIRTYLERQTVAEVLELLVRRFSQPLAGGGADARALHIPMRLLIRAGAEAQIDEALLEEMPCEGEQVLGSLLFDHLGTSVKPPPVSFESDEPGRSTSSSLEPIRIHVWGPNAAGKTSLIHLLYGQEDPTAAAMEEAREIRLVRAGAPDLVVIDDAAAWLRRDEPNREDADVHLIVMRPGTGQLPHAELELASRLSRRAPVLLIANGDEHDYDDWHARNREQLRQLALNPDSYIPCSLKPQKDADDESLRHDVPLWEFRGHQIHSAVMAVLVKQRADHYSYQVEQNHAARVTGALRHEFFAEIWRGEHFPTGSLSPQYDTEEFQGYVEAVARLASEQDENPTQPWSSLLQAMSLQWVNLLQVTIMKEISPDWPVRPEKIPSRQQTESRLAAAGVENGAAAVSLARALAFDRGYRGDSRQVSMDRLTLIPLVGRWTLPVFFPERFAAHARRVARVVQRVPDLQDVLLRINLVRNELAHRTGMLSMSSAKEFLTCMTRLWLAFGASEEGEQETQSRETLFQEVQKAVEELDKLLATHWHPKGTPALIVWQAMLSKFQEARLQVQRGLPPSAWTAEQLLMECQRSTGMKEDAHLAAARPKMTERANRILELLGILARAHGMEANGQPARTEEATTGIKDDAIAPLPSNRGRARHGLVFDRTYYVVNRPQRETIEETTPDGRQTLRPYYSARDLFSDTLADESRWVVDTRRLEAAPSEQLTRLLRDGLEGHDDWGEEGAKDPVRLLESFDRFRGDLERVLVAPNVSKHWAVDFVTRDFIPHVSLIVFGFDDWLHFGVIQSVVHHFWMRTLGARIRDDSRYIVSAFESFCFPDLASRQAGIMAELAQEFYETRQQIIEADELSLNLFTRQLAKGVFPRALEAMQRLNQAVVDAYGWSDLRLPADRWEPDEAMIEEIVSRLTRLNESVRLRT